MTDSEIKALAERIIGNHWDRFNQENREILLSTKFQDTILDAMCEMYKAALSGAEPLNGEEDEYVEKVKKIMEANETGVAEAIVDEIIMPIKNGARQYWQAAQSKHEELLKLQADLNHNIRRCLEIAEERDKALAALSGTDRIGLTENDIYSLVSRAQVAALKDDWQTPEEFTKKWLAGTERVECYLPCEFSEGEIYAGTEAGPLPLKLVTITVVPNHQS